MRVGQIMAGKHWGAMFIPRVGQEVIVTFVDGDPDRPLVTGVVYNSDQMPPYDPKEEPTKSYIKTNSSTGGEGYNELRFEDKKGKEQVFIHSERNMDVRVKASSMESVGGDRHLIIGGEKDGKKSGDQFEMVYHNKNLKIHRNQFEQIGGNMFLKVGGIDDGTGHHVTFISGSKGECIDNDSHVYVKKDRKEKVDGDQSLTVGGSQQEMVGMKHALNAGQEIHLKGGQTVVIEAGMYLTLKVGGSFITIDEFMISIDAPMVLINSGGIPCPGSGSAPAPPAESEFPEPQEPTPADSHKTGQKSTPY
jgi:type VI secretion system secreted protein VgrG